MEDPPLVMPILLIEDIAIGPNTTVEIARHSYKDKNLMQISNYV